MILLYKSVWNCIRLKFGAFQEKAFLQMPQFREQKQLKIKHSFICHKLWNHKLFPLYYSFFFFFEHKNRIRHELQNVETFYGQQIIPITEDFPYAKLTFPLCYQDHQFSPHSLLRSVIMVFVCHLVKTMKNWIKMVDIKAEEISFSFSCSEFWLQQISTQTQKKLISFSTNLIYTSNKKNRINSHFSELL